MRFPRTSKRISLGSATILLVGSSLLAQILGFLRTKLVNANFPAVGPHSTDSYFAAFNIPDFFFFTISAGALGVAFMPVLADYLARGDRKGMWKIVSSLLNLLTIVMFGVALVIFVFAGPIMRQLVQPSELHDAVIIMRLLALNPLLFTISGILTATQQTLGRFFFYATAPLLYNGCIIMAALLFGGAAGRHGGPWHLGIMGLGVGALVGAVLQLAVVVIGTYGTGFRWTPHILWSKDFRQVLRNLPPRSLDQGMDQLESIVETRFARGIGQGSISYYSNAYTLQLAPVLLIGTAISTAIFPRLNNRLSQGRPDLFRQDFLRILRLIIWITLPVVVVCFFGRGYLARMIFSKNTSQQISLIFGFLTVAILFRTIYAIISRWFYAQKDTRTPLYVSVFTISLNILLAYLLTRPGGYGLQGLAVAQSIVAAVEVSILSVIMLIRDPKLFDREFLSGVFRTISVTGFSLVAGYITVSFVPLGINDRGFVTLGTKLLLIAGVTLLTHFTISGLFDLEEARPFWSWIKRLVLRPVKVDY